MKGPRGVAPAAKLWKPLPQDLLIALLSLLFGILSFAFPGSPPTGGLPEGETSGLLFLLAFALSLLAPFLPDRAPALPRFVRTFYPQLLLALFFTEAIRLSGEVSHGFAFDGLVASWDRALFGFQPARRFHEALAAFPAVNELMFGGYFLFYVLFAVTPWIAWFSGRHELAEREIFVYVAMMAIIFSFYLAFRVEGPKYWFPDLRAAGYEGFSGGIFVSFFKEVFRNLRLDGAAFPSSHVAFALLMTVFARRTFPRLLWIYVPAFLLVSASTVYIYAHYVFDVLGGIVATLVLAPPLWRLYPRIARKGMIAA